MPYANLESNEPTGSDKGPSQTGFAHLSDGGARSNASAANPTAGNPSISPAIEARPPAPGTVTPRRRRPIEKRLNVNEIVKILYRGRWIILATFVVVFAYTVYSTYSKPFVYSSTTRMFIDKPPGGIQISKLLGAAQDEDHSIANQVQFFKSHVVSAHVARLLHEYAMGNRHELDSLFMDGFKSTRSVPPDPRQIAIIRMQDNPKLPNPKGIPDEGTLEARASAGVNVFPDGTNDYIIVTAEAYTPLDAAFIANLYVVTFAKDNLERSRSNAVTLKEFLIAQKTKSSDTLRAIEQRLKNYLGEMSGLNPEDQAKLLTAQIQETKVRRSNLLIELSNRKRVYADLTANLDTVQKNFFDNMALEPYIAQLQQEITASQFELEEMQSANHVMDPRTKKYVKDDIDAKKERIASLQERLKERLDEFFHSQVIVNGGTNASGDQIVTTKSSSLQSVMSLREDILGARLRLGQDSLRLADLETLLHRLSAEASDMPERIIKSSELLRAQTVAQKLFDQLEDKYLETWLGEESVFGNVKVEDPASLSPTPIRPNRQAAIFTGSLMGLGIGIGIVVLLSFMDTTLRSPDEIESHNIPLLGTIPVINHPSQQLSAEFAAANAEQPKFTPHRVSHLDPRSSVAEAYRSLRTAIQFAGLDAEIHTLAVSSSAPQEGKSTTSSNLGIVMAQMGRKTLLIDTDLRRPVLHSVFGLKREPGLTNVLFQRATLAEAIRTTDVPNLYILPCGIIPPNPAELLGSLRMQQLLTELKKEYDMIILDTPPVVAVTDALLLGRSVDATILIARADSTRVDALFRAIDSIDRAGIHFLGVILNNFNVANAYGSYYRYYQYYHYYSTPTEPKGSFIKRIMPLPKSSGSRKSS